jgi:hypothetical protein
MGPDSLAPAGFTIPNVRRDFPEWHLGRPRYALWALDVDDPSVRQRVDAAQRHLADLLLDGYRRQPHVTVDLCGFPCDSARHADDFGTESLHAQLAALRRARPAPFEIGIGALASFASAPYLAVHDAGGHVAALRECLASGDPGKADGRDAPHVTVGLYADAWPMSAVQARLRSFPAAEPLRVLVTGISLMCYAAAKIGGPLTRIAAFDFAGGAQRLDDPFRA